MCCSFCSYKFPPGRIYLSSNEVASVIPLEFDESEKSIGPQCSEKNGSNAALINKSFGSKTFKSSDIVSKNKLPKLQKL